MLSDIEIAQNCTMLPIGKVAEKAGLLEDELEYYGKYKAKISDDAWKRLKDEPDGKLILVTAINPTPAGEGKTTTTVGLGEALNKMGKNAIIALREPSLGPVFGIKGGAAGGGYAQVVPMEDINLHFTGDMGAGKTAFCRGFLHALGYTGRVTSPTFAIVNEYETELCRVCHFDMYRILDEDALYDIGWDDYFDGDTILLVEWSENVSGAMPEDCITVDIRRGEAEDDRIITIKGGELH